MAGSVTTQGSPLAVFNGSAITWSGTVAAGGSTVMAYQAKVTASTGYIANTATISHARLPAP